MSPDFRAGFLTGIVVMILAIVLIGFWPVKAESFLVASVGSYHFKRKDYCEVNPGVGFEHSILKDTRLVAGTYQNSLCNPSNYIGLSWAPLRFENWRLGVAAIAITGYEDDKKKRADKVIVVPLPTLSYEGRRWGANLVVIPPYEDFRGGGGLQLKVRF